MVNFDDTNTHLVGVCDLMYAKSPIYKNWPLLNQNNVCSKNLKNLGEIFTNLIQTLTSEVRLFNPNAFGYQGHTDVGFVSQAPYQFFFLN